MPHEPTALNPTLERILKEGTVIAQTGERRPLRWAISLDEGLFIQEIIRQFRPRFSLEVGCAYGVSSLFICQALTEVGAERHTIIDPYQLGRGPDGGYEGIGLANLERAGFSNLVRFHPELSYRCLPRLEREGCRLDFAFIDGMHTLDYVLVDFFYIDKMLEVGGVVIFDDLGYPSIRKLCRFILRNLPYSAVAPKVSISTGKRRVAERIASISGLAHKIVREEVVVPDAEIGLPPVNYVALKKNCDDLIGDGTAFNRRWDTHYTF